MARADVRPNEADLLASALAGAQTWLRHTGRVLHDDVGSELASAGLRLQILRMDHPSAAGGVNEVLALLDDAMEHVRALSQELRSSPAYRSGFEDALRGLVERHQGVFSGTIQFAYKATAKPDVESRVALYDAAAAALEEAVRSKQATRVSVRVTGSSGITIRVADNSRTRPGRPSAMFKAAARLARQTNLAVERTMGNGTIVSIRYAVRSDTGGRSQDHAGRHPSHPKPQR